MVILGIDAHKRTRTVVAVDGNAAGSLRARSAPPPPTKWPCCAGPTSSVPTGGGQRRTAGACPGAWSGICSGR